MAEKKDAANVAGSPGAERTPARRYAPGHDIEVLVKDTDTSWALFQALQNAPPGGYENTEPASLQAKALGAAALTVEDVLLAARRNNRVCPKPLVWQRLYDWLPGKPPHLARVPGTRAEWDQLPPLHKRSRLREHIEWAAVQGVLEKVHDALRNLPEERWHHIGD